MTPVGLRMERAKRLALADCSGLLTRACIELDQLMGRGAARGLAVDEVEDLGPLAVRVVQLRQRRRRLEVELRAITSEWAA